MIPSSFTNPPHKNYQAQGRGWEALVGEDAKRRENSHQNGDI
jgi:hypothetical protein